jgi:16S rRNA (uracil1498-N3)-methyltransferase
MPSRFFVPEARETGQTVALRGEEFHHLRKVLRLEPGATLSLFDGGGRGFEGRLVEILRGEARVLVGREECSPESPLPLTLMAALAKGEKFDLVVQKATELGVHVILPFYSKHADVRPAADRESRKPERWRRIALSACKQSGRTRLPLLQDPQALGEILARPCQGIGVAMDPESSEGLGPEALSALSGASAVTVAVGPEGGWSDEEREAFHKAGFLRLHLGPRILRTETAAIVAAAILQFVAGDLGAAGTGNRPNRTDKTLKTKV